MCKMVLLIDWVFKKINGQILSTVRAEKDLFFTDFPKKSVPQLRSKFGSSLWKMTQLV